VQTLVEEAAAAVQELRSRDVLFDLDPDGELSLGLEGGHTRRRIVHSGGSATGHEITSKLAAMVAREQRIEVRERASMTALWSDGQRCHGVLTEDGRIAAAATVLATGGAAALWRRTSNPWGAIGAGPTMAAAAGAELADLEFCQFHPTALFLPGTRFDGLLITEAVRGEGATLLDSSGRRFTDELSPRDAVTAALLDRLEADGTEAVGLDLRELEPARFPNVFASLREAGLEPATDLIPVAPASHYTMGGIAVDLEGRSSLAGLYAVGECSCTGLHGANRLASNSLSECFVFGARAGRAVLGESRAPQPPEPGEWRFEPPEGSTRDAVWRLAGPRRDPARLEQLLGDPYPLARAIAKCALERRESRGGHLRSDFTSIDPALDGIHIVRDASGETRREAWR
jgi:L-aspartate oxidase